MRVGVFVNRDPFIFNIETSICVHEEEGQFLPVLGVISINRNISDVKRINKTIDLNRVNVTFDTPALLQAFMLLLTTTIQGQ